MSNTTIITLKSYEVAALRTSSMTEVDKDTLVGTYLFGLSGEKGEVLDLLKKHIGHKHELDLNLLSKEIGDTLWYVVCLGHLLETPFSSLFQVENLDAIVEEVEYLRRPGDLQVFKLGNQLTILAGRITAIVDNGHTTSEKDKLRTHFVEFVGYLALIANYYGLSLRDIADKNNQKLLKRYPEGFSSEASKNRQE